MALFVHRKIIVLDQLGYLIRLAEFKSKNATESATALERLRQAAVNNENVFAELMNAVRYCSLGQITDTFFVVGGQYRRNM